MKKTLLLHNQDAGDDDYFKSELMHAIEKEGFSCTYFPIKHDDRWKEEIDQADFIIAAGGDGTIRRVVKELMKKEKQNQHIPFAILPLGTANNLSKSLNPKLGLSVEDHIKSWKTSDAKRFDFGAVYDKETVDYFLEGAGYGLFAQLINKMDSISTEHLEDADDKLRFAREELLKLVLSAEASPYYIKADKRIYNGNALLIEIMNIPSIGPNLVLSPDAQTDDGMLDIVCIQEEQRDEFAAYIKRLINDEDISWRGHSIKARRCRIVCQSRFMHVDDEASTNSKEELRIEVMDNALKIIR